MGRDVATHQIPLIHQSITIPAVTNHLAIAFHGIKPALQRIDILIFVETQNLCQLLPGERFAFVSQNFHNKLSACDGSRVFASFAFGKGI